MFYERYGMSGPTPAIAVAYSMNVKQYRIKWDGLLSDLNFYMISRIFLCLSSLEVLNSSVDWL